MTFTALPDAKPRPALTAMPLDRAERRRAEPDLLARLLADPNTRMLGLVGGQPLVTGPEEAPRLVRLTPDLTLAEGAVFLGLDAAGHGWVAASLAAAPAEGGDAHPGEPRLGDIWQIGHLLPAPEAAIAIYARGIALWHRRHGFCSVCGQPTSVTHAGHRRLCSNLACKAEHFPRTDPAVIMLVTHEDRALLARNPRFPPDRVSTLAGFVEPGESLEDCVRREVEEEVGLQLGRIDYVDSQPWPFPASLMMGFVAEARSTGPLTLDPAEVAEAHWFDRAALVAGRIEGFRLPPRLSIARFLIDGWAARRF